MWRKGYESNHGGRPLALLSMGETMLDQNKKYLSIHIHLYILIKNI
jgi:hypothetical protein